jgi:hypothetical protein
MNTIKRVVICKTRFEMNKKNGVEKPRETGGKMRKPKMSSIHST